MEKTSEKPPKKGDIIPRSGVGSLQHKVCADTFAKALVFDGVGNTLALRRALREGAELPSNIGAAAYHYARNVDVRERIEFYEKKRVEAFELNIKEIAQALHDAAFYDVADFYDASGAVLPIHEIPPRLRRLIKKVEHGLHYEERIDENGDMIRVPVMTIARFETESRHAALSKIIDMACILETRSDNKRDESQIDKKQLARKLLNLVHQASIDGATVNDAPADGRRSNNK